MSKVIPLGYTAPGAMATLEALMQDESVLLIDTRYSPKSKMSGWNRSELKAKYGARYRWAGQYLGNVNYQGGPIWIANPDVGVSGLIRYLSEGHNLILLCACASYTKCHRKVIVDLLLQRAPRVEIVQPDIVTPPGAIKCISVKQPWASWLVNPMKFIDAGIPPKAIENRDWTTSYRGPLLIHASAKFDGNAFPFALDCISPDLNEAVSLNKQDYAVGALVGVADLTDVVTESDDPWFLGKYGFVLANARPIGPIPWKGSLKLFDVSLSVVQEALTVSKQNMVVR